MKKKIGGALIRRLTELKTVVTFVVLTLFKLPEPGANIYVQSLLKFPSWGVHERSKSPPYPVVPPLGHNIDSCIVVNFEHSKLCVWVACGGVGSTMKMCPYEKFHGHNLRLPEIRNASQSLKIPGERRGLLC